MDKIVLQEPIETEVPIIRTKFTPSRSPVGIDVTSPKKINIDLGMILEEKNYKIMNSYIYNDKIFIIKAYNRWGDMIYILPNVEGVLNCKKHILISAINNTKNIEDDVKINLHNMTKGLQGVIIKSNNEYSVVTSNDKMDRVEFLFRKNEAIDDLLNKYVEAYPIISIKEIMEIDDLDLSKRIRRSTLRIQSYIYNWNVSNMEVLISETEKILNKYKNIKNVYVESEKYRIKEQKKLLAEEVSSEDLLNKNKIFNNMNKFLASFVRHSLTETLIHSKRADNVYYSSYIYIKSEYDNEMSKDIMSAEKWGLPKKFDSIDKSALISGNFDNPENLESVSHLKDSLAK